MSSDINEHIEALIHEKEASRLLGLSVSSLRARRRLGQSPEWIKIGGRVLYRPSTLQAFVNANVVRPIAELAA